MHYCPPQKTLLSSVWRKYYAQWACFLQTLNHICFKTLFFLHCHTIVLFADEPDPVDIADHYSDFGVPRLFLFEKLRLAFFCIFVFMFPFLFSLKYLSWTSKFLSICFWHLGFFFWTSGYIHSKNNQSFAFLGSDVVSPPYSPASHYSVVSPTLSPSRRYRHFSCFPGMFLCTGTAKSSLI